MATKRLGKTEMIALEEIHNDKDGINRKMINKSSEISLEETPMKKSRICKK